jgi:ubiquinone/menaquinone biosynthesis C-methylase UbiE
MNQRHRKAKPRPARSAPSSRRLPSPPGPRTDWGDSAVAGWYDQLVGEQGSEYHRRVIIPGVLRMLGGQKSQTVLDLACGQGVLCRILHGQGLNVTGVDASAELIAAARARAELSSDVAGPRYVLGDARDLSFLPERGFDAVTCVLAIQNMHPLRPVFDSVARVLRPGGRLILVMMHPCFRGPQETSWGWDERAGVQYRRVDRYLLPRKHPIVTHPGKDPGTYTWTFHKPIQEYVRSMRAAGMVIDMLEEWPSHKTSGPGPRAAAENTARSEIPLFMAIRAVKLSV